MKHRKSQVSLEYLVIYGFGIVVIVFSLVLAWQSGIFTKISTENKGIGGFSQIIVKDFNAKARENSLNLTVKNNAPDSVRLMEINATIEYKVKCNSSNVMDLAPGAKIITELNCPELEEKYPSREYFKANIIIQYLNIRSNHLHESRGYIWGTVE